MVKDAAGREGLSAGAIAREVGVSPSQVSRALASLKVTQADFVKAGCGYYYRERLPDIRRVLEPSAPAA